MDAAKETVALRSDLLKAVEKDAEGKARTINDIVNHAVERYLGEQRRAKLHDEIQAYVQMHPRLKKKYLGQWVAVYEHKLVDHDPEAADLYRRVRAEYGDAAILIRQVELEPDPDIWVHTPSTGNISP